MCFVKCSYKNFAVIGGKFTAGCENEIRNIWNACGNSFTFLSNTRTRNTFTLGSSPYNAQGFPNRLKIPNRNANNVIINYTITKRELVVNGITKVFKRVITPNDVKPFFELFLPEKNVLGITSVLLKSGTEYTNIPTVAEFLGSPNKWYEVDALAEDRVFIEDPTKVSDQPGIKVGRYIQTSNRFISEYTPEGFKKLTFGGGTNTAQDALDQFTTVGATIDLQRYSNNLSLGSALSPNSTLFVQYRVGGGLGTNLGTNVITQIGTVSFFVNGPSELTNSSVVNSFFNYLIRVLNIKPCVIHFCYYFGP